VTVHPLPDGQTIRPVIAVESRAVESLWDDPLMIWDGGGTWDFAAAAGPWPDLFCDAMGMTIESGHPDDTGLFDTARLTVTVDNRSGRWAPYNADGSLTDYGPGRHIAVWATDDAAQWWLFYGRVSRWDELADDILEVEAFDLQSDLAQPLGTFTAGTAGQSVAARVGALLNVAGFSDRRTLDTGTVALTAQATDASPLEEAQTVAQSDGGVWWSDADGTLRYTNRLWRVGRTDQAAVPVVSYNVCADGVLNIWAPVLSTNDLLLADQVTVENLAGVKGSAGPVASPSGAYRLTMTDLQYTTQAEADTLAAYLLAQQSRARLMVEAFDVYLADPLQPELVALLDVRLFDHLRFVHDAKTPSGPARLDLTTLVISIDHEWTPGDWRMTVGTTRAIAYTTAIAWDQAPYVWDDSSPAAVWAF
jgi:hypothetical protein